MWGGQLDPVASTGISSYFSKFIPVLLPEKSSLKKKNFCKGYGNVDIRWLWVLFEESRMRLTVPGARWELCVWTSLHLWIPLSSGCYLHQWSPHAHICTRVHEVWMHALKTNIAFYCYKYIHLSTLFSIQLYPVSTHPHLLSGKVHLHSSLTHTHEKTWCRFYTPSSWPCSTVIEVGVLGPIGPTPETVVGSIPWRSSPVAIFAFITAKPCNCQKYKSVMFMAINLQRSVRFFPTRGKA